MNRRALAWIGLGIGTLAVLISQLREAPLALRPSAPDPVSIADHTVPQPELLSSPAEPLSWSGARRVRVVDAVTGEVIAGAVVSDGDHVAQDRRWVTSATGEATLDGVLVSGPLVLSADGYFDGRLPMHGVFAPGSAEVATAALWPRGRLIFRITDAEGRPVEGVQVLVNPRDQPSPVATILDWPVHGLRDQRGMPVATSGSSDQVTIESLPCGLPLVVQWSWGGLRGEREVTIPVAERELREAIVLADGAVVIGRLVDKSGAALAARMVEIQTSLRRGGSDAFSRTRPDGTFRATGVSPGPAVLVVQSTSCRVGIEVVAPLTDVGDVVAEEPVEISGIIIDGALPPQPAWAYLVEAVGTDGLIMDAMSLDGSGFSLRAPRGPVELRVRSGRSGFWVDHGVLGRLEVVAPASSLRIELESLSGQIRGQLPPSVTNEEVDIVLFPYTGSGERGVTWRANSMSYADVEVAEGEFLLGPLSRGTYDLHVQCGAAGSAWIVGVVVPAGAQVDLGLLDVGRGKLACRDPGNPDPARIVVRPLVPAANPQSGNAAEPLELEAGPWLLFPDGVVAYRSHGVLLDIHVGEVASWHGGSWGPRGSILGTVLTDGAPRPGVDIELLPLAGRDALAADHTLASRQTNDDGQFSFEQVIPGDYAFRIAGRSDQESTGGSVAVVATAPTQVVLELPSGSTRIRLLAGGKPLDAVTLISLYWTAQGGSRRWVGFQRGASVDVPSVAGGAWLTVDMSPRIEDARPYGVSHAVRLESLPPGQSFDVEVPQNTVTVQLTNDAVRAPEPTVRLAQPWGNTGIELQWRPTRGPAGRTILGGLPAGALLHLSGRDANGHIIEREIRVPLGGSVIRWP